MSHRVNKAKVLSSLFWKFMERGGTQGIQFIVQIILARLLLPEDYGIIALVVVFTSIASIFVQSGLNTALIQKKDADELDFSSVFYLSLFLACIIYFTLFFLAPSIAIFYNIPEITPVFRVLSITLIFGVFNSIQNAVISRRLQFKKLFLSSTGAFFISGIVGIYMAYTGFGVWALVWHQISNSLAVTLILWFTVKWRPRLLFSYNRVKSLFSYGWKLLLTSLINRLYDEISSLIIGKMYAPAMLGFYNRGRSFPQLLVSNLDGSIQSVMFPVLSSQQDNKTLVKNMMRRSVVTSSFFVFPMMVGLAVIAEPLVKLLLTEKWLPAVPFIQIFCVSYVLTPIQSANLEAIKALGYSDVYLKLALIKRTIGIVILIITVFFGVYAIAMGQAIISFISSFINAHPNKRLLDYSYREQWCDIMPSFLLSLVMGVVIFCVKWLELTVIITLILQIFIGIFIYMGLAWIFKLESFAYLLDTIKDLFSKRQKARTNNFN